MGGHPTSAVTSLSIPRSTEVSFVEDLITGLSDAAERWGIALVGGDISEAAVIVVTIALLGRAEGSPVLRSGARPGDSIYVTGTLGGAAGGLALLRSDSERVDDPAQRLRGRQLRPEPRVAEGVWLAGLGPSSMIDLSDGLARDLSRVLDASDCGCLVEEGLIPVDPDLSTVEDIDPLAAALCGGEDLELLFTIGPAGEGDLDAAAPTGTAVTRIGEVTESGRMIGDTSLEEWRARGWDHLR
jgi:thiamine-monophosphate kinase